MVRCPSAPTIELAAPGSRRRDTRPPRETAACLRPDDADRGDDAVVSEYGNRDRHRAGNRLADRAGDARRDDLGELGAEPLGDRSRASIAGIRARGSRRGSRPGRRRGAPCRARRCGAAATSPAGSSPGGRAATGPRGGRRRPARSGGRSPPSRRSRRPSSWSTGPAVRISSSAVTFAPLADDQPRPEPVAGALAIDEAEARERPEIAVDRRDRRVEQHAELVGPDLAAVGDRQQDPQPAGERRVLGRLLGRSIAGRGPFPICSAPLSSCSLVRQPTARRITGGPDPRCRGRHRARIVSRTTARTRQVSSPAVRAAGTRSPPGGPGGFRAPSWRRPRGGRSPSATPWLATGDVLVVDLDLDAELASARRS